MKKNIMNKLKRTAMTGGLCGFLLNLSVSLFAQTMTEWKDLQVNDVNRLPVHAPLFPYESEVASRKDITESKRFFSIEGTWKFWWTANADDRIPTDFFKPEYNDRNWGIMPVPGMWELNPPKDGGSKGGTVQQVKYGAPVYVNIGFAWHGQYKDTPPLPPMQKNHVGLYRHTVTLPADWTNGKTVNPDMQYIMHLGSVTSCVYVWVNGTFVGYAEDSKLAAEFDVTPYLKAGENLVALQVYRWSDGSYCEDQDMWRLTGIARQSYLYCRNRHVHIDNLKVIPVLDKEKGLWQLDIVADVTGNADIVYRLTDRDGREVARQMDEYQAKTAGPRHTVMQLSHDVKPQLWSAETPYLYRLTAETRHHVKKGSAMALSAFAGTEVLVQKVGLRTTEVRDGQLLVNGKPILIKGVDRHELDPEGGYVMSMDRMRGDIKRLKEFNFNAVRTSHYMDDPRWYDLCDEYGIYLVAEANMESHGFGYDKKKAPTYQSLFAKQILERNQHNVLVNYNHPSVIVWSMGNETIDGPNFTSAYKWIKENDKSRPVQFEQAKQGGNTDIFCPMYYSHKASEQYSIKALEAQNDGYPEGKRVLPLIQCEYNHAMGNSSGGFKDYWDLIRRYPNYQGGFIWDFADQAFMRGGQTGKYGGDYDPSDPSDNNFNCNGVFLPDRTPSPQAFEIRYQQQNVWVRAIDLEKGKISVKNENFFRPLDNIVMHWTLSHDGVKNQEGDIDLSELNIAPQDSAAITVPYRLYDPDGEILLDLSFRLKEAESMLAKGHEVASQQLSINRYLYDFVWACEQDDVLMGQPLSSNSSLNDIVESIKPNFWRAPTDNDMGAKSHLRYAVWREPRMTLVSDKTVSTRKHPDYGDKMRISATVRTRIYKMQDVPATLTLVTTSFPSGAVIVEQTMKVNEDVSADSLSRVPGMLRYGVTMQLPSDYQQVEYYGRGPWENYSDRNSAAMLGTYRQTVDSQFFPYIRPQETGTRTDIRRLTISSPLTSSSLRILPYNRSLSFSALNYTQQELDETYADGNANHEGKHQRHPSDLRRSSAVNLCIDLEHAGVGGENSWSRGAEALPQYRVAFGNKTLRFLITPK